MASAGDDDAADSFKLRFKTLAGTTLTAEVPRDATVERMKQYYIAAQVGAPDPGSYLYDGSSDGSRVEKVKDDLSDAIRAISSDVPRDLVSLVFDFCYVVVHDAPIDIETTRMISEGKRLIDDQAIQSFGIHDDSLVYVVFRLHAGAGPAPSTTHRSPGDLNNGPCSAIAPPPTRAQFPIGCLSQKNDSFEPDTTLTRALRAMTPDQIVRASALRTASEEEVHRFSLQDTDICSRLCAEVLRWAKCFKYEPLAEVNTKKLQLHKHVEFMAKQCIMPAMLPKEAAFHPSQVASVHSVVFQESDENPLQSLSVCEGDGGVSIAKLEVGTVPWHEDASDYTINLCLDGKFDDDTSKVIFDGAELKHRPGYGAVHKGSLRHRVTRCTGWRVNLLMFVNMK